jgi:hypothetical protein
MKLAHLVVVPIVVVLSACAAAREAAPPPKISAPPPPAAPKPSACRRPKPAGCVGPSPSFARDVAPVLQHRCFSCHANGGMAADDHDFSHFATLHAQRESVVAQVGACAMPPPEAPTLDAAEADMLLRWAACGAPEN